MKLDKLNLDGKKGTIEVLDQIFLAKVNPKLEIVYYGNVSLEKKGDEKTAVRFSITRDGSITGINFLPKTLVIVN